MQLAAAESYGFEVFVTTDTYFAYQQNLFNRAIAIVVLITTSWPRIQRSLAAILSALTHEVDEVFQPVSFWYLKPEIY